MVNAKITLGSVRIPRSIAMAVFIAGIIITLGIYSYTREQEYQRVLGNFNDIAKVHTQRVRARVEGYERTLHDLRGLFAAGPEVTQRTFERYLDAIDVSNRYSALLRIGYAPLLTDKNKKEITTYLDGKRQSFDPHDFKDPAYPVIYEYPFANNAIGNNLAADAARLHVLNLARDENHAILSAHLVLRFDRQEKTGFLLYLPVYQFDNFGLDTVTKRRQALVGYLYAVFRIEDLINTTVGPQIAAQISLSLHDGSAGNVGSLVYQLNGQDTPAGFLQPTFASTQDISIYGREWLFVFTATPQFIDAYRSALPASILLGGLVITTLLAWLAKIGADRLAAERQIRFLAYHDEMTGLPNRFNLRETLSQQIAQRPSNGGSLALLVIELNHFREINYTFGHLVGDRLLRQVGIRLNAFAACSLIAARISNIQFGLVVAENTPLETSQLAERILRALRQPIEVGEINYELGAYAGIAFFPDHGDDCDAVLRHADIARLKAVQAGRNVVVYDPHDDPFKPQRLELLGAFRKAVAEHQLELYLQPKTDIRAGVITGVEALVRWNHPLYGMISPAEFVALIEPTELIQLLTQWMLEASLECSMKWREENIFLPIAVNVSARNLNDTHILELVQHLMAKCDSHSRWLDLEITESSLMEDSGSAVEILNNFHLMGLKLFVDDFGTGYSSFNYLMKLPVDVIKIDLSFISNMLHDTLSAAIVKTMIELAHNVGMSVVAEGVASKEIWDALKALNCDEGQGYYVCKPLPAAEFLKWLRQSAWKAARVKVAGDGRAAS